MNIMFDFMDTNDWNKALQHVPKRKLVREDDISELQLKRFLHRHKDSKSSRHNAVNSFF